MIDLKNYVRTIPDHPKPGIMFRDITTLFQSPAGLRKSVDDIVQAFAGKGLTKVAGIEARGFILGGAVAHQLSIGFVPIRKKGKLPWSTLAQAYELEYGTDEVEIHTDAFQPGEKVLLIDDLIATGGTAEAGIKLIERAGGYVAACAFIIDLPELGGAQKLRGLGKEVLSLIAFDGH